ncbi:hypothetical protein D9758_009103 [Tetrapyrgos nigripes]|uniref:MYND-type domain-containing protein n=1 Tax=Tetrapyrgos nigripes TaxID=182062 RepID=A0A8H5G8G5_9AGAR|nr:hypothetical protein D9758_009103 [Tetrapyrgos nigripes]
MSYAGRRKGSSTSEMISAAYRHFRGPVPTSIDPDTPSRPLNRALLYLGVLSRHIRDGTRNATQRRDSMENYKHNWPFIWSWTSILLKKYVLEGSPSTAPGLEYRDRLLSIVHLVVSFHTDEPDGDWETDFPPSLSLLQTSPDIFLSMVDTWKFVLDNNHPSLSSMFYLVDISLATSLADEALFVSYCQDTNFAPKLIHQLLSYIYTELRQLQERRLHTMQSAFRMLAFLAREASNEVLHLFLTRETLVCVTWAFKLLTNPRIFSKLTSHAASHSIEFLKYIHDVYFSAFDYHGASAIALVFRGDVIHSVSQGFDLVTHEEEGGGTSEVKFDKTLAQLFADLLISIPAYFCHRRVLKAVLQSLQKEFLRSPSSEATLEQIPFGSSPGHRQVLEALQKLKTHAVNFQKSRELFEKQGRIVCANLVCPRRGTHTYRKFRRKQCARCQVTTYCSEQCQRRDWKADDHRTKCDRVCSGVLKDILTDVDRQFMEWYTIHQAQAHREIFNSIPQEHEEPTLMHVVYMDYRDPSDSPYPKITTSTVEHYLEHGRARAKGCSCIDVSEHLETVQGYVVRCCLPFPAEH